MRVALPILVGLAFTALVVAFVVRLSRRAVARALASPETVGARYTTLGRLIGAHGVGSGIVRGTGVVALHHDRLVFVLGVPSRVMSFPLSQMTDLEVTKVVRFPGRYSAMPSPMVVVRAGEHAGMAVLVRDPEALAAAIRQVQRPAAPGTS